MTEVQGIKTKTCNYNMDPYPLDVWGATGGKNSEDIWDVRFFFDVMQLNSGF